MASCNTFPPGDLFSSLAVVFFLSNSWLARLIFISRLPAAFDRVAEEIDCVAAVSVSDTMVEVKVKKKTKKQAHLERHSLLTSTQ